MTPQFVGNSVGLLVFDLDGTLIDSRLDLATAVNATLMQFGRPAIDVTMVGSFVGDGASMLVERSLRVSGGVTPALLQDAMPVFLRLYGRHMLDHTYVYEGVLDALATIRRCAPAVPMAVLTNKPVGPSMSICEALGLSDYFFANYGGNSFATKKPDPEGLLALIRKAEDHCGARIAPAETVMIGDSEVDVLTARAAGAASLGCSYGLATDRLLAAKPDAVVDHAREWPSILGLRESTPENDVFERFS